MNTLEQQVKINELNRRFTKTD